MAGEPTDLERSLLHTACWFAVQGYAVTAFELWKWLWFPVRRYSLAEVSETLGASAWLAARLENDGAHYALRGGEPLSDLVRRREERFADGVRKFRKLRRAAGYLGRVPTVLGVFAGNTLAWWHTREESDIDLFVVARSGTVWLTRLLSVLPFALLRRRPGNENRDPFCFSFFVSETAVGLGKLRLFGCDPYFAYWTRSLVPVVDKAGTGAAVHAANAWCEEMLPHAASRAPHAELRGPASAPRAPWLARAERAVRRVQERRFPQALREAANQGSAVVIGDDILKFHENDRREAFRDRFQELITAYGG